MDSHIELQMLDQLLSLKVLNFHKAKSKYYIVKNDFINSMFV